METDFNKHENLHKNQCVRFSNLKDQKVEIETSALRTTDARRSFFFSTVSQTAWAGKLGIYILGGTFSQTISTILSL